MEGALVCRRTAFYTFIGSLEAACSCISSNICKQVIKKRIGHSSVALIIEKSEIILNIADLYIAQSTALGHKHIFHSVKAAVGSREHKNAQLAAVLLSNREADTLSNTVYGIALYTVFSALLPVFQ